MTDDGMNAASEHTHVHGGNNVRLVERERSVIGKHNNKESIRCKCELSKLGSAHFPLKQHWNIPMSAYAARIFGSNFVRRDGIQESGEKLTKSDSAKKRPDR